MTRIDDRLHRLCEGSRRLTGVTDLADLLAEVARGAQDLCDADGCAVRLCDERRAGLYLAGHAGSPRTAAAYAAGVRLRGGDRVAAAVASRGEPLVIGDVAEDTRFGDVAGSSHVRAVLCVPLRTAAGVVGVLEMTDPRPGHFTHEDREALEAFAANAAVAYEKTLLADRIGGEVLAPRQVGRLAGVGFIALGLALAGGATFTNLALALPLSGLPTRPGVWPGLVCALAGVVLLRLLHGVGARRAARRTRRSPMTAALEA